MAVLVLDDQTGSEISQPTRSAVAAAGQIDSDVHVLVLGVEGADAAAKLPGVSKVLKAAGPAYEHGLAEPVAALLVSLAPGYSHLLAPGSASGKNILPRVAALLDVQILSEIAGVEGPDTFRRYIYAGNALATVKTSDEKKVLTVRAASFDPVPAEGGNAPIEDAQPAEDPGVSSFVGAETGKIVAPELYIAVGISGAIQHLAGMKDSKVIVAINKDEEAPIFQVADYGLVGDLFKVIPELTEELDKVR